MTDVIAKVERGDLEAKKLYERFIVSLSLEWEYKANFSRVYNRTIVKVIRMWLWLMLGQI